MADRPGTAGHTALPAALVAVGLGVWVLRQASLRWGATSSEAQAALLGDDLVPVPDYAATNATTVQAAPGEVWPWLVQMGAYTRAGWYSFDRFDNGGVHSAWEVVPELQHLQVGEVLPTDRDGTGFVVERLDPPHAMVLVIREQGTVTSSVFVLREHERGTRLLCRLRLTAPRTTVGVRYRLLMELGHVPMTLSMLAGIRRRAEGARPGASGTGTAARTLRPGRDGLRRRWPQLRAVAAYWVRAWAARSMPGPEVVSRRLVS